MLRFLVGTALVLMMSVPACADSHRDYDEPARAKHPLTIRSGEDHRRPNANDMVMTRQLLVHLLSNYDDRSSFQKSEARQAWKYREVSWRYRDDVDKPRTRVPEPTTFLMVGAGLAGLVYARRFFRR
jgi:PEP-CTERM motif-containing protein